MFSKEFVIRFTLADIVKLLLLSPIAVLLFYGVISLPWGSANAPAWVQALGSIGAILVAAWAAIHASKVNQRAIDRAAIERVTVVWRALFVYANNTRVRLTHLNIQLHSEDSHARNADLADFWAEQMESDLQAVKAIKLTEMPSIRAIKSLLSIISGIERSIAFARLVESPNPTKEYQGIVVQLVRYQKIFDVICEEIPYVSDN